VTRRALAAAALALLAAATALAACDGGGGDDDADTANLVVYESTTAQVTDVFTMDPDSGKTRNVTQGTGFNGMPGWSHDKKRILFSSDRDAERRMYDLYTVKPDGSDVRRITNTPDVAEWSAKFDPTGERIGLIERRKGGFYIVVMGADGANARTLAGPMKFAEFPAWSRDGTELAFAGMRRDQNAADIFGIDVASGELHTIIGKPGADLCPHYSRDGKFLNYASSDNQTEDGPDIYLHDLEKGDATQDTRLTTNPGRDDYATPSPDGKRYVFLSQRDGNMELYIMDADGSNQRRLTDTPGSRENVPDW